MSLREKLYKVIRTDKEIVSIIPGNYAGNKTHKIFGRLDCKSGMRMKKANRVFFFTWADAIAAGYRPCKSCKPKSYDSYSNENMLPTKPHIALWKSSPPPDRREPKRAWYACLNWEENDGDKTMNCQVTLSDSFLLQKARTVARALGKKYNLPVLQHSVVDFTIIWFPIKRPNDIAAAQDRKAVKELQASKTATKIASTF